MSYTIIAFQLPPSNPQTQVADLRYPLDEILEETAKFRVDICEGIYVFETVQGWRDMHRLRSWLVSQKKAFVELQDVSVLAGLFSPAILGKLSELNGPDEIATRVLSYGAPT